MQSNFFQNGPDGEDKGREGREDKGAGYLRAVQISGSVDLLHSFYGTNYCWNPALENQVGVRQPTYCFVSGHDFSRATTRPKGQGFSPCHLKIRTNFQWKKRRG